jgi:hypothetical protein
LNGNGREAWETRERGRLEEHPIDKFRGLI